MILWTGFKQLHSSSDDKIGLNEEYVLRNIFGWILEEYPMYTWYRTIIINFSVQLCARHSHSTPICWDWTLVGVVGLILVFLTVNLDDDIISRVDDVTFFTEKAILYIFHFYTFFTEKAIFVYGSLGREDGCRCDRNT